MSAVFSKLFAHYICFNCGRTKVLAQYSNNDGSKPTFPDVTHCGWRACQGKARRKDV